MSLRQINSVRAAVVVSTALVQLFLLSGCGGATGGATSCTSTSVSRSGVSVHHSSCLGGIDFLVVDPLHPQTVYAVHNPPVVPGSAYVYKSADGGLSWARGGEPPSQDYLYFDTLVLDPRRPNTFYAGTVDGVYKSTDGGANWTSRGLKGQRCGGSYLTCFVKGLTFAPSGGVLYAFVDSGTCSMCNTGPALFESKSGVGRWVAVGLKDQDVLDVGLDPREPSTMYALIQVTGSVEALFKSTDAGVAWHRLQGIHPGNADSNTGLWIDPRHPQNVYADIGRGLFKSTDGGVVWRRFGRGPNDLAFGPRAVYAATGRGVFTKTNAGEAWQLIGARGKEVDQLAISANGRILYALTAGSDIYRFQLRG